MRQFSSPVTASPLAEPEAEQRPRERILHDLRLIDEYAWLKAENWREVMRDPLQLDPAIRAYLKTENDYCERALADTKSLQETLFAEMKGRIKEDDSSAPGPDGPYAYYVRYRKEGQHPLLCRAPRNCMHFPSTQAADVKPEEQLLLDGDALAHGKAFFRLGATRHSPDHRLLAWLADEAGSEFYTARVRVIDSGADLADVVPDASSAVVWTQDASAFYYVRLDQNHRPDGVFRHALGKCARIHGSRSRLFHFNRSPFVGTLRRYFGPRSRNIGSVAHRSFRTQCRADAYCRAPIRRPARSGTPSRL